MGGWTTPDMLREPLTHVTCFFVRNIMSNALMLNDPPTGPLLFSKLAERSSWQLFESDFAHLLLSSILVGPTSGSRGAGTWGRWFNLAQLLLPRQPKCALTHLAIVSSPIPFLLGAHNLTQCRAVSTTSMSSDFVAVEGAMTCLAPRPVSIILALHVYEDR